MQFDRCGGSDPSTADPAMDVVAEAYVQDHAVVLRRAMAVIRDPEVAADVTQEAFVRLLLEVRAGRQPDQIRSWLMRVVTNAAISRGRRISAAARYADRLPVPEALPGPEDVCLRRESSTELGRHLAALPPTERRALVMAAHGVGGRDIATAIGRSYPATRVLLHRSRLRLRASFELGEVA
jgi:RNA polymerase sigma-70 factor (ECF subfamily)